MHALIMQHGSALVALAENLVPHINAPVEFNQNMSKSTHERCNRLQKEWCAKQHIESTGQSETPQE